MFSKKFSKNGDLRYNTTLILLFVVGFATSITIQLLDAVPAKADCTYAGKTYKTGDTRGPYICMPNGKWQQR